MDNILYTNNKIAHVTGILEKNVDIRNEHLKRNIGKYSQWKYDLSPAIGEAYQIDYQRPFNSMTNGESLLDYTHNSDNVYSNMINSIYFPKGREKDVIGFENLSPDEIQSMVGKYVNYVTYMDEIFGEDVYSRHVRYINDLLSGQYIENALRQTEVNVIRPMVSVAKQGVITTNTQNMSGVDTTMGTISNYMYSTLLYNGAIFNSDRKSNEKYITPSLFNQYGNNLSNVTKLADLLTIGTGEKRLNDDLGADVKIIHNPTDRFDRRTLNLTDITHLYNDARKYIAENNVGYNGFLTYGKTYVKFTRNKGENRFIIDTKDINKSSKFSKESKINSVTTLDTYDEKDILGTNDSSSNLNAEKNDFNNFEPINNEKGNGLLDKTAKLFNEHKINTLIGRFHTSKDNPDDDNFGTPEFIDTAKIKGYGNSHGRNLLKRNPSKDSMINGYDNPYCRVWTYHHQYNQVKKLIRPFLGDNNDDSIDIKTIQGQLQNFRPVKITSDSTSYNGGEYLAQNTVLGNNGFINICPKEEDGDNNDTKKYMFSIENLAWKDILNNDKYLSKEQRGPNGGRIMWFPPYDLDFNENIAVRWSDNEFIGRGERIYTYNNTDRSGNLSFTLLIDHPSIVNNYKKLDDSYLKSIGAENDDVDAEILRFFAGCQMPDFFETEKEEKPKEPEKPQETIKPRVEHIKFHVFFPNNYSGGMSDKSGKNYELKNEDWWEYILFGLYTSIYDDDLYWYGYECGDMSLCPKMIDGFPSDIKENWIGCCEKNEINKDCSKEYDQVNKETGEYCWQYRVDNDLRQILGVTKDGSYKDDKSYKLNIVLNDDYHKDDTCSFGEFIYALLNLKKLKFNNIKNKELSDDEIQTLSEKAQSKIISYGANNDNIDKLLSIISEKDVKLIQAKVYGSADKNDPNNSNMLANRRAQTLQNFLKNTLRDSALEVKIEKGQSSVGGKQGNDASTLENKRSRSVLVDIEYQLKDQVSKLSDGTSGEGQEDPTESGATKEMLFDEWYKELLSGSTIIQKYESIINNDEYEKEFGAFQYALKKWMDDEQISYNLSDYTEDRQWIEVVNKIMKNYGYNFLINSSAFNKEILSPLIKDYSNNERTPYHKYFLSKTNSLTQEGQSLKDENASKENQIKKIEEDVEDLTKKIEKLGGEDCNCDSVSLKNDKCDSCKGGKIGEVQGEIISILFGDKYLQDELKNKEKELYEKQYELDHWSVKLGDKLEIKQEINKLERDISNIKRDIEKNKKDVEKKRSEIEDLKNDLGKYLEQRDKKNDEIDKLNSEIKENEEKFKELENKISSGDYSEISEDLVTLYYYNMAKYPDSIDYRNYMESDDLVKDGEQIDNSIIDVYKPLTDDDYMYDYDTKITINDEYFKSYTKFKDELVFDAGKTYDLSFYQVMKDYFVIDYLKDIKEGIEFGLSYLFENYKEKFSLLRDVRFMYALITEYDKDEFLGKYPNINIISKTIQYIIDNNDVFTNYDYLLDGITKLVSYTDKKQILKEKLNEAYTIYKSLMKFLETTSADILKDINSAISSGLKKAKDDLKKWSENRNKAILNKKNKDAEKAKLAEEKANLENMRSLYFSKKTENSINRYETEAEYFNRIKLDDPLVFKSIRDKLKYFNPAYHSISPEGFNARLNFLQQCTRQGPTCEIGSNSNANSANNLSFGRMPVCVLRIGDFIHTKIIIESLSIQYGSDGIQFDLNPDGIGVQPMYAKINLGIKIIGGQSLKAPISRLQNAISFNYYANTGVYDDRSDIVDYKEGKIEYKRVFDPTIEKSDKNTESVKTNVNKKTDKVETEKENYADLAFSAGKDAQKLENMIKE